MHGALIGLVAGAALEDARLTFGGTLDHLDQVEKRVITEVVDEPIATCWSWQTLQPSCLHERSEDLGEVVGGCSQLWRHFLGTNRGGFVFEQVEGTKG
jgi:hypothetical protein